MILFTGYMIKTRSLNFTTILESNCQSINKKTCFDKQVKTEKQLQNIFPKLKTKNIKTFL